MRPVVVSRSQLTARRELRRARNPSTPPKERPNGIGKGNMARARHRQNSFMLASVARFWRLSKDPLCARRLSRSAQRTGADEN